MARVLAFPLNGEPPSRRGNKDSALASVGESLSVVSSTLPSGEGLPLLVDRTTWLPASLALRWTVLKRRYECAESTLRRDLNGLRYVYAWGHRRFPEGLEARLEAQGMTYEDLVSLRDFCVRPMAQDSRRRVHARSAESTHAASVKVVVA